MMEWGIRRKIRRIPFAPLERAVSNEFAKEAVPMKTQAIRKLHAAFAFALVLPLLLAARGAALDLSAADLDGDGRITLADLKELGRHVNTQAGAYRGDLTGDNVVDEKDVRSLARVLINEVSGGRKLSDAEVDRIVRHVVRGDTNVTIGGGGDGGGDGGPSSGPGATAPGDPRLTRALDGIVNRIQAAEGGFTIDRLQTSVQEKGLDAGGDPGGISGPGGSASGGGRSGGGSYSGGASSGGAGGSSGGSGGSSYQGKAPEFPPDLRKVIGALTGEGRPAAAADTDIDAINARRTASLGGSLGSAKIEEALKRMQGKGADAVKPSDTPDAKIYLTDRAIAERDRGLSGSAKAGSASRERTLTRNPGANVKLEVTAQDAENPKLSDRLRGGERPLTEDYRKTSADPADRPDHLSGLIDSDVSGASDDPLVSQTMKDAVSPTALIGSGGGAQGAGTVNRGELMVKLFNPGAATQMMGGSPESVGIKSGTTFHTNYVPIAETEIPKLIASGALPPSVGQETLDTIRRIQQQQAGGGGGGNDGFDPFGVLSGILSGDPGAAIGSLPGGGGIPGGVVDAGTGIAGGATGAGGGGTGTTGGTSSTDSGGGGSWYDSFVSGAQRIGGAALRGAATGLPFGAAGIMGGAVGGAAIEGVKMYNGQ